MQALKSYLFKPIIPVIFIRGGITAQKSEQILNQLTKKVLSQAKALAIVIDSRSGLPAQSDLIASRLRIISQKYHLPIYGFAESFCTASPYYLLSISNKIYCQKNSLIGLTADVHWFGAKDVLNNFGIQQRQLHSSQNLMSDTLNVFANKPKGVVNQHYDYIQNKLADRSLQNRRQKIHKPIQKNEWYYGQNAISAGLADQIGSYQSILAREFPQCNIKTIHYSTSFEKFQRTIKFLTSPAFLFVVGILLVKATIKWSLIVYLWIRHEEKKQKKQQK